MQRLDLIADDTLVVETESTYQLPKAAAGQLFNYPRATNLEVGLLLHFGPEAEFYRAICENGLKPSLRSDSSPR